MSYKLHINPQQFDKSSDSVAVYRGGNCNQDLYNSPLNKEISLKKFHFVIVRKLSTDYLTTVAFEALLKFYNVKFCFDDFYLQ